MQIYNFLFIWFSASQINLNLGLCYYIVLFMHTAIVDDQTFSQLPQIFEVPITNKADRHKSRAPSNQRPTDGRTERQSCS